MRHRRSGDLHEIRPPEAAGLLRRVRLATGLVLLAYLATHLLNHALGLISLATMGQGGAGSWRSGATRWARWPSTAHWLRTSRSRSGRSIGADTYACRPGKPPSSSWAC
jgi:hypothetical protein